MTGHGCAAPDLEVTGETPEGVLDVLTDQREPVLRGTDPLRSARMLEELRKPLAAQPSAMAAVDMALHDILGKAAGLPLWKILGGYRDRITTSVTIGILPEEETVGGRGTGWPRDSAASSSRAGRTSTSDIARVRRVREAVGTQIELRFDANQGYTVEEAHALRGGDARRPGWSCSSSPRPRGEPDLLGRVTGSVHLPVMADESLMTLRDAFRIARRDLADMVNIKLMKVGGIAEALPDQLRWPARPGWK